MTRLLCWFLKWAALHAKSRKNMQSARAFAALYGVTALLGWRELASMFADGIRQAIQERRK